MKIFNSAVVATFVFAAAFQETLLAEQVTPIIKNSGISYASGTTQANTQSDMVKSWQNELNSVVLKEKITMLFPIAEGVPSPNMQYGNPQGYAAMEALARATRTSWKQVNGIQVFQPINLEDYDYNTNANKINRWIANLTSDKQVEVAYSGIPFTALSSGIQHALLAIQYDPDMQFVLLDKKSQAKLQIELIPSFKMQAAIHPKLVALRPIVLSNPTTVFQPSGETRTTYRALDKQPVGTLDFGKGKILLLQSILNEASKKFNKPFVMKHIDLQKKYFVSGTWDEKGFLAVVQTLNSSQATHEKLSRLTIPNTFAIDLLRSKPDLTTQEVDTSYLRTDWAFRVASRKGNPGLGQKTLDDWSKQYGGRESLSFTDFARNVPIRVDVLVRERPGLAKELEAAGISLDDNVIMTFKLQIVIVALGQHQSSLISMIMNGQAIRMVMPNRVSFGLPEPS